MDAKLRKVLELALHPNTGEAESQAALRAARKLTQDADLNQLLQASSAHSNLHKPTHSMPVKLTVPATYMHNMIERLFEDAHALSVTVRITSCRAPNRNPGKGMILEFIMEGSSINLNRMGDQIRRHVAYMQNNSKQKTTSTDSQPETTPDPPAKKGWFAKWFGS